MLYLLPLVEHDKARPLFAALDHHQAVNAILDGAVPGTVYADDLDDPAAALGWVGKRFYLAGDPARERFVEGLHMLFAEVIYPRALEAGATMFVLYHAPGWEQAVERILAGKHPIRDRREYWELRASARPAPAPLPPGVELRTVDRDLLADERLQSRAGLVDELTSERDSVDDFLAHSLGVCLVEGDEIVGWCLSEYDSSARCELGIETLPAHRRRGLATAAAAALVERALAHGRRRIGWHCWASNVASSATARKVGFEKVEEYAVYFAWFDEVDNLAVNGNIRLRDGNPRAALEWYRRAFFHGEAKGWAYWSAAVAHTRLGEPDQALAALRQALTRGYGSHEELERDPDLAPLHAHPGWPALLAELPAAKPALP